jgi:hypothetical protein
MGGGHDVAQNPEKLGSGAVMTAATIVQTAPATELAPIRRWPRKWRYVFIFGSAALLWVFILLLWSWI